MKYVDVFCNQVFSYGFQCNCVAIKLQFMAQMCKPWIQIIIFQIMINGAKLHSIIIYKHEIDLK